MLRLALIAACLATPGLTQTPGIDATRIQATAAQSEWLGLVRDASFVSARIAGPVAPQLRYELTLSANREQATNFGFLVDDLSYRTANLILTAAATPDLSLSGGLFWVSGESGPVSRELRLNWDDGGALALQAHYSSEPGGLSPTYGLDAFWQAAPGWDLTGRVWAYRCDDDAFGCSDSRNISLRADRAVTPALTLWGEALFTAEDGQFVDVADSRRLTAGAELSLRDSVAVFGDLSRTWYQPDTGPSSHLTAVTLGLRMDIGRTDLFLRD